MAIDRSDPQGILNLQRRVPDTITTWTMSAFAMNENVGFGLLKQHQKITVIKKLFMDVRLPDFMFKGETAVVTITIFNYHSSSKRVILTGNYTGAKSSGDIDVIERISANSQVTVLKEILIKDVGTATINLWMNVLPDFTTITDAVKKEMEVKAGGVKQHMNTPVMCSLSSSQNSCKVPITFKYPPHVVPGSKYSYMTVTGEIIAPSIERIENLIRMPSGCGEQTMIGLVPDIVIMKYLTASCKLTDAIKTRLLQNMNKGIEHELTWKRRDGSFSIWGQRDNVGSTWLTAYVVNYFVEAKVFTHVDTVIIRDALQFLIQNQDSDGSFRGSFHAYHTDMQGGTTANAVTRTAFISLALLESMDQKELGIDVLSPIMKAKIYLEPNIQSQEDPYTLAIVTYTLKKMGSSYSSDALRKLRYKGTQEGDALYWILGQKHNKRSFQPMNKMYKTKNPLEIETAAYALLALIAHSDATTSTSIMKWLISQRNPSGGFLSTQDTVIAIRALSEYSAMINTCNGPSGRTHIQVSTNNGQTLTVSDTTKNSVQRIDIPVNVQNLLLTAQGVGTVLIDVVAYYNVESIGNQTYNITSTIISETFDNVKAKTCIRRLIDGNKGMVIVEIGLPTGFKANLESISTSGLRHKESDYDKINLYFDQITTGGNCITFEVHRVDKATHSGNVPVRAYDYYYPVNQGLGYYSLGLLKDLDLCRICTKCESCQSQMVG